MREIEWWIKRNRDESKEGLKEAKKYKDQGKKDYERRNGLRRKNGKKESIRNVTLEERERGNSRKIEGS